MHVIFSNDNSVHTTRCIFSVPFSAGMLSHIFILPIFMPCSPAIGNFSTWSLSLHLPMTVLAPHIPRTPFLAPQCAILRRPFSTWIGIRYRLSRFPPSMILSCPFFFSIPL